MSFIFHLYSIFSFQNRSNQRFTFFSIYEFVFSSSISLLILIISLPFCICCFLKLLTSYSSIFMVTPYILIIFIHVYYFYFLSILSFRNTCFFHHLSFLLPYPCLSSSSSRPFLSVTSLYVSPPILPFS